MSAKLNVLFVFLLCAEQQTDHGEEAEGAHQQLSQRAEDADSGSAEKRRKCANCESECVRVSFVVRWFVRDSSSCWLSVVLKDSHTKIRSTRSAGRRRTHVMPQVNQKCGEKSRARTRHLKDLRSIRQPDRTRNFCRVVVLCIGSSSCAFACCVLCARARVCGLAFCGWEVRSFCVVSHATHNAHQTHTQTQTQTRGLFTAYL